MEPIEFEDGSIATINADYSVTIQEEDGASFTITGFPTESDAHDFCLFGDFEDGENDFVLIIKPKFKLKWIFHNDAN